MTEETTPARRGRRPAGEDTRGLITEAARSEFADKGYEGTSMRAVARVAGVDPALVHHYFEGKADLFAQSVVLTRVNPAVMVERVLDGPLDTLGDRLVRTFLRCGTTRRTRNGSSRWSGPCRPTTRWAR